MSVSAPNGFSSVYNVDKVGFAYASITIGITLLNSVFSFFYVKVFLEKWKVSENWFQISQMLYLVWNTINDPLFAYFLDNSKYKCFRSRGRSIIFGAPIYVLSFFATWFNWGDILGIHKDWVVGVHLIFSLCFYDSLFTFVCLAQLGLFTEISTDLNRRLNIKWFAICGSLLASWPVALTNYVSDSLAQFGYFQLTCVALGLLGYGFMVLGARNSHSMYDHPEVASCEQPELPKESKDSYLRLTIQILRHRDFIIFVTTNFLQILQLTFWGNFLSIFIDALGPGSTFWRSFVYLAIFIIPNLVFLFGKSFIGNIGHYKIIQFSIYAKIVLAVVMYIFGGGSPLLFCLYALTDSILGHIAFSLYDLVLAEIADMDKEAYHRDYPLSAMVFGTNALVTKPAISIAPMIVVAVLNRYGYASVVNGVYSDSLRSVMFLLSCAIPLVVGLVQLCVWSRYSMRFTTKSKTPPSPIHDAL